MNEVNGMELLKAATLLFSLTTKMMKRSQES